MKRLFLIYIALFASLTLAQDKPIHCIGVGAGGATGVGLSYRFWHPSGFGGQVNYCPMIERDKQWRLDAHAVALTVLRMLLTGKKNDCYLYIGSHFMPRSSNYEYDEEWNRIPGKSKAVPTYIGGGPGIEIKGSDMSVNLMAGILYLSDDRKFTGTGEIAIYFRL